MRSKQRAEKAAVRGEGTEKKTATEAKGAAAEMEGGGHAETKYLH